MKFQDQKVLEHWLKHRGHSPKVTADEVEWYYEYRQHAIVGYSSTALAFVGAIFHFGKIGIINIKNNMPIAFPALMVLVGMLLMLYSGIMVALSRHSPPDARLRSVVKQLEKDISVFMSYVEADPRRESMQDLYMLSASAITTLENLCHAPRTELMRRRELAQRIEVATTVVDTFVLGGMR